MKGNESDYDVIIVWSRVAGSITGILLGEKGYRVLVLDRVHFPSDPLSTHFSRTPALLAFNEVGVYDEVQAAAPQATVTFNVIDGIAFVEPVDRPEDYPFFMCLRRITLDDIIVRQLTRHGWDDLELDHGFYETQQGLRFTICEEARREVLHRLLELNHQHFEEEIAHGSHEKKGRKRSGEKTYTKKRSEKKNQGSLSCFSL